MRYTHRCQAIDSQSEGFPSSNLLWLALFLRLKAQERFPPLCLEAWNLVRQSHVKTNPSFFREHATNNKHPARPKRGIGRRSRRCPCIPLPQSTDMGISRSTEACVAERRDVLTYLMMLVCVVNLPAEVGSRFAWEAGVADFFCQVVPLRTGAGGVLAFAVVACEGAVGCWLLG